MPVPVRVQQMRTAEKLVQPVNAKARKRKVPVDELTVPTKNKNYNRTDAFYRPDGTDHDHPKTKDVRAPRLGTQACRQKDEELTCIDSEWGRL